MGYTTEFEGVLKFKKELTRVQLAYLKSFLGQDIRDLKLEKDDDEYWYHIDLELTNDFTGLQWDGSEKTYGLHSIINFVTKQMREEYPDFELVGQLKAQGDEIDDRWLLVMEDGVAKKVKVMMKGKKVECPHCEEEFILEEKKESKK